MSSPVTNLNSSTVQEIVNWVTTADGCVHSADTTQPDKRCVLGIKLQVRIWPACLVTLASLLIFFIQTDLRNMVHICQIFRPGNYLCYLCRPNCN